MDQSTLYGLINVGELPDDIERLHINRRVIEGLIHDDEWPRITRSMFSFTGPECLHMGQLIHFAASYSSLDRDWDLWLNKFEYILRQLQWIGVTVHLSSEWFGDLTYRWRATGDALKTGCCPTTTWEFSGGPRKLMLDPSPEEIEKTNKILDELKHPPNAD